MQRHKKTIRKYNNIFFLIFKKNIFVYFISVSFLME